MTRTRYKIFEKEYPYFITCTTVAWMPVFSRPELVRHVLESFQFLQKEGLRIFGYVIMENHYHLIARSDELARQIDRSKSFVARKIIDDMQRLGMRTMLQELEYYKLRHRLDQKYQLWQEGKHPKQIQNDDMMWQKLEYTHNNPLRRGYVDDPVHWRYSSARNYAGQPGLLDVETNWM